MIRPWYRCRSDHILASGWSAWRHPAPPIVSVACSHARFPRIVTCLSLGGCNSSISCRPYVSASSAGDICPAAPVFWFLPSASSGGFLDVARLLPFSGFCLAPRLAAFSTSPGCSDDSHARASVARRLGDLVDYRPGRFCDAGPPSQDLSQLVVVDRAQELCSQNDQLLGLALVLVASDVDQRRVDAVAAQAVARCGCRVVLEGWSPQRRCALLSEYGYRSLSDSRGCPRRSGKSVATPARLVVVSVGC